MGDAGGILPGREIRQRKLPGMGILGVELSGCKALATDFPESEQGDRQDV